MKTVGAPSLYAGLVFVIYGWGASPDPERMYWNGMSLIAGAPRGEEPARALDQALLRWRDDAGAGDPLSAFAGHLVAAWGWRTP